MIELKVKPHGEVAGKEMIEVWNDGVFIAGVYPHVDGIVVASKYLVDSLLMGKTLPPSVLVVLKGY